MDVKFYSGHVVSFPDSAVKVSRRRKEVEIRVATSLFHKINVHKLVKAGKSEIVVGEFIRRYYKL